MIKMSLCVFIALLLACLCMCVTRAECLVSPIAEWLESAGLTAWWLGWGQGVQRKACVATLELLRGSMGMLRCWCAARGEPGSV